MRVSDRERARAVELLHRRREQGYLSLDTLVRRLDHIWGARDAEELARPLADLPPSDLAIGLRELCDRARTLVGPLAPAGARAWRVPGGEVVLRLPRRPGRQATLGRSRRCDVVISGPTVSREHVQVTWTGGGWRLLDLGSLNGTWVGRRRVAQEDVRPGTVVVLGEQPVRLR